LISALRRTLVAEGVLLGAGLIYITMEIALAYTGQCGGLMPFIAAATPCTRMEYVQGGLELLLTVVLVELWPFILPAVLTPPLVAWWLDRNRSGRVPKQT
jgi:hypothetical protein